MTTQANTYSVLPGPVDFLASGSSMDDFYTEDSEDFSVESARGQNPRGFARDLRAKMLGSATFERLNPTQCIEAYSHQYVAAWGDLLVEHEAPIYQRLDLRDCSSFSTVDRDNSCYQGTEVQMRFWDNSHYHGSRSLSLMAPYWTKQATIYRH